MNYVHLTGRITSVPELRHTPKGTAVAETTLCVDDGYGDSKRTYFFRISFWDKKAETAAQHLVKGQKINVTGKLTQEEFTPKGEDKPKQSTRITVFDFDFLERPAGAEGDRTAGPPREPRNLNVPSNRGRSSHNPPEDHDDDEIPF